MAAGVTALLTGPLLSAAGSTYQPAQYRDGALPALAPLALAGGEVVLEVAVGRDGSVTGVKTLRTLPPYTAGLNTVVKTWRFVPAELTEQASGTTRPATQLVASTVLVVGLFGPPSLNTPTLGDRPRDIASEADGTPFPMTLSSPTFPLLAHSGGVVLIETKISVDGRPTDSRVIRSSPPFDKPALDALARWRFRPARIRGLTAPTLAYIIFAFQQPVTGAAPGRP